MDEISINKLSDDLLNELKDNANKYRLKISKNTLGTTIIYIGFSVFALSIINFLISIYKKQGLASNQFFLLGILNLLPFVIYDPELFYPRHIIIGLCFLSLNHIYNRDWSTKLQESIDRIT